MVSQLLVYDLIFMVLSAPILRDDSILNSSGRRNARQNTVAVQSQLQLDGGLGNGGNNDGAETSRYGINSGQCPNGAEPQRTPQGQVRLCQLDDECPRSYKCHSILGLIHFGKQLRYCCPTKISVCTIKPIIGIDTSSANGQRCTKPLKTSYYFDVDRLRCVKDRIAQCDDFGANRFATELECRTKCETTACELGESILLHDESFDSPYVCEEEEDCPIGYSCREDKIFRRNVCCGFLNFEPCPFGFRSFTVPFTGRAKTCTKSVTRDECPTDYVCAQNAVNQEHYCCTSERGICPTGHQAYIHPLTNGAIKCNLGKFESSSSCPYGFTCLHTVMGSNWGFCCSLSIVGSCQKGTTPQLNPSSNEPQKCEEKQPHTCAVGFTCELAVSIEKRVTGKYELSQKRSGFCCSVEKRVTPPPRRRLKHVRTTTTETPTSPSPIRWHSSEEKWVSAESTAESVAATTIFLPKSVEVTHESRESVTPSTSSSISWPEDLRPRRVKEKRKRIEETKKNSLVVESSDEEEEDDSADREDLVKFTEELGRFSDIKSLALKKASKKPSKWQIKHISKKKDTVEVEEEEEEEKEEEKNDEEDASGGLLETDDEREQRRRKGSGHRAAVSKQRFRKLHCPERYRPMFYPGTRLQLQCTDGVDRIQSEEDPGEKSDDCPKPSVCMRARNDRLLRSLCCLSKGRRGFIWRKKETKGKNRIGKNSEESSLKPLAEEENSRKSHESDDNEASENSEDEKSSYETERNRENRKKGRNRKKTDAKKGSRKLKKAKSGESGEESSGGKKSRRTVSYSRETAAGEQEQLENEDIKEKGDEEDSVKTARE